MSTSLRERSGWIVGRSEPGFTRGKRALWQASRTSGDLITSRRAFEAPEQFVRACTQCTALLRRQIRRPPSSLCAGVDLRLSQGSENNTSREANSACINSIPTEIEQSICPRSANLPPRSSATSPPAPQPYVKALVAARNHRSTYLRVHHPRRPVRKESSCFVCARRSAWAKVYVSRIRPGMPRELS